MILLTPEREFDLGIVRPDQRIVRELEGTRVVGATLVQSVRARMIRGIDLNPASVRAAWFLLVARSALDAGLDKTIQHLDDDAGLFPDNGGRGDRRTRWPAAKFSQT